MPMDIKWLAEQGPCKEVKAGDVIPCPYAKPGEQKAMYILLTGGVDVFGKSAAGGVKKVSSIAPGDVLGGREYFLNTDDLYYRAREDSNMYVLTEESFNDLSWSQPEILFEILRSAYTPPRKPVATAPPAKPEAVSAKAPAAAPAKAAEAKSEAPAAKAPAATPAKAPVAAPAKAGETKAGGAVSAKPAEAAPAKAAPSAIAAPSGGGLFPEGHKIYKDKEFEINEKLIFQKEYNCPFCKKPFQDYRVFRSKLYESRPMRFDMRKFYTGFIAEWYDLITCRNCYFTTFHNYFTDPKPIKRDAIEDKLTAVRADFPVEFNSMGRDINDVFLMHYLALLCCDGYPSLAKQLRAKLWGNLSWLYEDVEDKEMEKLAALKAIESYEEVYTTSRLTPVQEQITCLSIAGMQHRAGVDNNLKKFLFAAKTNTMGDKTYSKLADDFWYELSLGDE